MVETKDFKPTYTGPKYVKEKVKVMYSISFDKIKSLLNRLWRRR